MTDRAGQAFYRDGLRLIALDPGGGGRPFVFQHGLLGDAGQTWEIAAELTAARCVTLEMRGHGKSELGPPERLSIATFADDLAAFLDGRNMSSVVLGGISMGAAIALRLAVLRPDLVRALVLVRPAWIAESAPPNMRPYAMIGELLASLPGDAARESFEATETARMLGEAAPDNLASLRSFFLREPRDGTTALLRAIGNDCPGLSREEIAALGQPALVLGSDMDLLHPLAMAEELARLLRRGRFAEITPKGVDKGRYLADIRRHIASFLTEV